MTNSGLFGLGVVVVIIAFVVMALHPYQRSRARFGSASAGGPVWFVILVIGIGIVALAFYLG